MGARWPEGGQEGAWQHPGIAAGGNWREPGEAGAGAGQGPGVTKSFGAGSLFGRNYPDKTSHFDDPFRKIDKWGFGNISFFFSPQQVQGLIQKVRL